MVIWHRGNQISCRGREIFVGSNLVLQWVPGSGKVVRGDTKVSPGRVSAGVLQRGVIYTIVDNHTFLKQLRMEQNSDLVISKAKQIVLQGELIEKGRLKRIQKQLRIENDLFRKNGRPILPTSLQKFIVHEFHSTAYFGSDKIYAQLKLRFYWPNMYGYISFFIKSCTICQQVNCDTSPPKAPLISLVTPDAPMQFISLDIAYMPLYNHGCQFVLLIDAFFFKVYSNCCLGRSNVTFDRRRPSKQPDLCPRNSVLSFD